MITFLNEPELIFYTQWNGFKYCYVIQINQFRHTVKEFQVLLFNINNFIQHYPFVLHTGKWSQVLLCITNNSIKHQSSIYTQLNDQTVLFLTIQFSLNHLFVQSLKVKQSNLTHRLDPIGCYHSRSGCTFEQLQWKGIPRLTKLQVWSLAIRLFNVNTRTFVAWGGAYTSVEMQLMYSTAP